MKILHVLAQLPSKTGSGVYYSNMIEGFKKNTIMNKELFLHIRTTIVGIF